MEDNNKLNKSLDKFLKDEKPEETCVGDQCVIKTDKSMVERINKKIVTQDGRQLLT